jgi:apolipoprotein N-acyltransferase
MTKSPLAATGLAFHAAVPVAPLQHMALWTAELTGWRRLGVAWLLGALAAAALPPVDLTPLLAVSFSGLVWLADGDRRRRDAFLLGWSFGCGFFVAGLYWIAAALFIDIARFWWLVPFAVLGVPVGLGIFTGGALLAAFELRRRLALGGTARVLVLAAAWSLAEWLRGHVLTGFPWNLVGYAWSGGFPGSLALLQTTAVTGIYGLSLVTVIAAMLPATLGDLGRLRRAPLIAALLLIALPAAGGAVRLAAGPPGMVPGVTLRLVQPAIAQTLRNDPSAELANFEREMALSRAPVAGKLSAVLWAESGGPPFLNRDPAARRAIIAAVPPGGLVIAGTVLTDPPPAVPRHIWNSLVAIDGSGEIVASYDKSHLVPFGEYVPLRGVLPIQKITPGAIDFSSGDGPRTLTAPGLPPVGPLICYEVIFPGAVVDPALRPGWLLNITNDAWYGFTSGPFQHFDIARVRAVEEGLPLVRVANSGISGVIDPYGRVTARLDLDAVGNLDAALPRALPPTLYARAGDAIYWALLLATLLAAWGVSRGRRGGRER